MVGMGGKAKRGGKSAGMSLGSLGVGEVEGSSGGWGRMWDPRVSGREEEVKSKGTKTTKVIDSGERNESDVVFVDGVDKGGGSGGGRRGANLAFGATARQVSPRD
jgi:hypothetical protein